MRRLTLPLLSLAFASAPAWGLEGSVAAVHAQGLRDGGTYESGAVLKLEHDQELGGFLLTGQGRLRWNSSPCPFASGTSCEVDPLEFDWRELYLARNVGEWRLSAGLQQVVWGRADNLRVMDVVNPLDLREFLLPDFNESRIATGMLRAVGPVGDWNVEAVWQPDFEPTRMAQRGSPYDMRIEERFRSLGVAVGPAERPGRDGGEGGLVVSTTRGALDLSLMGYSGYNDDPVYVVSADADEPTLRPVHRRHALVGAGFARALESGWVARAEATWSPDAPYSNLTGAAPTRASTLTYLVAADYAWKDWLFSGQLSDRRIAGHRQDMAVAKRAAVVMFSATGSSHQGRMAHRLAWTLMPQNGDGHWLQWRSSWQFDDRWQVEATVDLLQGRESGFIGQFRDRDRGRIELRYQF